MKIPKKINPDNLKDSIVQVLFNPKIPPEMVPGVFYRHFSDSFNFIASSPSRPQLDKSQKEGILLQTVEKSYFLDKTEEIKIDVRPSGIVFNTYRDYIGWNKYYATIKQTVTRLFELDLIDTITRIGVRYISQFDNVSLPENLYIDLSINPNDKKLDLKSTQLRSEFIENDFKIILNLHNNITSPVSKEDVDLHTSIIDIDVIQFFKELNNPNLTLQAIEDGHQKQKETFFSLLKPAFLESLNPEYG